MFLRKTFRHLTRDCWQLLFSLIATLLLREVPAYADTAPPVFLPSYSCASSGELRSPSAANVTSRLIRAELQRLKSFFRGPSGTAGKRLALLKLLNRMIECRNSNPELQATDDALLKYELQGNGHDSSNRLVAVDLTPQNTSWISERGLNFASARALAYSRLPALEASATLARKDTFSVGVWIRPTFQPQDRNQRLIAGLYTSDTRQNFSLWQVGSKFNFVLNKDGKLAKYEIKNLLTGNELQYLVVTYDGILLSIYRNGVRVFALLLPGIELRFSAQPVVLGNQITPTAKRASYQGDILSLSVHARAFSPQEVLERYTKGASSPAISSSSLSGSADSTSSSNNNGDTSSSMSFPISSSTGTSSSQATTSSIVSSSSSSNSSSLSSSSASTSSAASVAADCGNGIDDDQDGLVDTADFDCFGPNQQESHTYSGYTRLTPSSDSRIIYVSSSGGNDANNGLSPASPLRSIEAGYLLLRHGYPDYLLLKREDTWDTYINWSQSGRSPSQPAVLGSYGLPGAPRPSIRSPNNRAAFAKWVTSIPTTDHVAVVGIHFEPRDYRGETGDYGIWWLGAGSDFLLEDCVVRGFTNNITIQYDGNNPSIVRDIKIRRNIIDYSYSREDAQVNNGHSEGLIVGFLDNLLIEENIIDHNGYKEGLAEPNVFNHNMYITHDNTNVVVRNNIIARASSHGLGFGSGGIAENNLFVRNPIAMYSSTNPTHIVDNVVIEGTDILASPPIPRAFGFELQESTSVIAENNIVANKLSTSPYTGYAFNVSHSGAPWLTTTHNAIVRSNIVYNWGNNTASSGSALVLSDPQLRYTSVSFTGNVIQQNCTFCGIAESAGALADPTKILFADNIYYGTRDPNRWFYGGGYDFSFNFWRTQYYPDNSTVAQINFADPTRNLSTYNQSIGGAASFDAFMADAKAASRQNWSRYSASTVNDYIRAGFQ